MKLIKYVRNYFRYRSLVRSLNDLPDQTLEDAGILRYDIKRYAKYATQKESSNG